MDELVYPTKERNSKGDIRVIESPRGGVEIRVRRAKNDILAFYFKQDLIDQEQLRAGCRYRALYQYGYELRERYVGMKFGTVAGEVNDEQLADNAKAYQDARAAIRQPARKTAFEVCCFGMKAGKDMELLRTALNDLAGHFNYRK